VDESHTDFVIPAGVRSIEHTQPDLYQRVVDHLKASRDLYVDLTTGLMESHRHVEDQTERRKKCRSAARCVLPNATETKIVITANARALRHFIEMRAHPAAELEIRQLAVEIFKIMTTAAPQLFHGMRIVTLSDNTEGVESEFRKI
jgi:thymidylate synthase (FAD)